MRQIRAFFSRCGEALCVADLHAWINIWAYDHAKYVCKRCGIDRLRI